jgi:hypothetical protein
MIRSRLKHSFAAACVLLLSSGRPAAAATFEWLSQLGSTSNDFGNAVAADAMGNVVVTGRTGSDIFVSLHDATGLNFWTRNLSSTVSALDAAVSASLDGLGNIYIGGFTFGDLGGPDPSSPIGVVSKYDSQGNHFGVGSVRPIRRPTSLPTASGMCSSVMAKTSKSTARTAISFGPSHSPALS